MNTSMLRKLSLAVALASPLVLVVGCTQSGSIGTSHVMSHTESDTHGWFGGQTHAANTVYKNSDGTTSVETETTTVDGDTTTIARVKKTTNLDGSVSTARETHKIVKGSDNSTSETTVNN